jgi:hypothetical protein
LKTSRERKLLVRLYKVLGPPLAKLVSGIDLKPGKKIGLDDIGLDSVADAMIELAVHLREEDLEYVVDRVFASESVEFNADGDKWVRLKKDLAEAHFAGSIHEQFHVLAFALEVNYAGFFDAWGSAAGLAEKLATPTATPSASPENLTGQSGESQPVRDTTQH